MKVFAFLDKASILIMTIAEFSFALLPNYIESILHSECRIDSEYLMGNGITFHINS